MVDRKQTPDILGSLLGNKKTEALGEDTIKPEYHKAIKPVKQPASKTANSLTSKTVRQKKEKPVKEEEAPGKKVKATYYISSEIVESLEDGWLQLRRLSPREKRGQISKSLIVELALQIALEELENKKDKSSLFQKSRKE